MQMVTNYTCLTNALGNLTERGGGKGIHRSYFGSSVLTGFFKRLKTKGIVYKHCTLVGKSVPHWIMV